MVRVRIRVIRRVMVMVNSNPAYNYDYTALWAHFIALSVCSYIVTDACF